MGPYVGLKCFFARKSSEFFLKNRQYCPKLGVPLKNYLHFLNGHPNVKDPEVGVLDTLPLTLHHILTLSLMLDLLYGTLVHQP